MTETNPTTTLTSSSNGVRILQFTDTHLFSEFDRTLLKINTYQSFHLVLEEAYGRGWIPDVILATGDLTQVATPKAYSNVRACFETFCSKMQSNQSENPIPVYWLPGNHDNAKMMAEFLPGGPMQKEHRFCQGNWQVILLDSSILDEVGGHLSQSELAHLEKCLTDFPDHFALVCLHHNALPTTNDWMGEIGLSNADQFFALIDCFPQIKAVLGGHIHQEFERVRNGVRFLATPSTCFQFKPNTTEFALDPLQPGYRWLHLLDNGEIQTGIYRLEHTKIEIDLSSHGY